MSCKLKILKSLAKVSCLFLGLCQFSTNAYADKPTIFWGQIHFPPVSITEGELAGQGIMDRQTDLFIKNLPQYEHVKITVTVQRLIEEMVKGSPFCFPGLIKSKNRETFISFSEATALLLSNGIIVASKQLDSFSPFLNENGEINFEQLIKTNSLRIKYQARRSYSQETARILEQGNAIERVQLIKEQGFYNTTLSVQQALEGRIDGFIARPGEGFYAAKKIHKEREISFLPISGQKQYSTVHVGCAKDGWDTEIMTDINRVAISLRNQKEFVQSHLNWLPTLYEKQFRRLHEQAFSTKFPSDRE